MPSTEFSHTPSLWAHERQSDEHHTAAATNSADPLADLFGDPALADACQTLALAPRAALPANWASQYRFAIIRRGYLIRQRGDGRGHSTAVDAVGPGGCFPFDGSAGESAGGGYAVTRALVSLCDDQAVASAFQRGGNTALQIHQLDTQAIARMERLADARGRSGTAGKVAALLCVLADTLEQPTGNPSDRIPGEFLQRDLAGLLSIRHESVCRALREFTGRDWIAKTEAGLLLKDRTALAAV